MTKLRISDKLALPLESTQVALADTVRDQLLVRLFAKVTKHEGEGCWEWTGYTKNGYGAFSRNDAWVYLHRLSYELNVGAIGDVFDQNTCSSARTETMSMTCSRKVASPNRRSIWACRTPRRREATPLLPAPVSFVLQGVTRKSV